MEAPRFAAQRAAPRASPWDSPHRVSIRPINRNNRVARQSWTSAAAESPPKVSRLFLWRVWFVNQGFQAFSHTRCHVSVPISDEVNSVAVGHIFQLNKSLIDWRSGRSWRDTARVHDLKVGNTMANQLFNQFIFEPYKTGHHGCLKIGIFGIGAVTTVIAALRKQVSR